MIKEYQLRKLQNSYEVTLHYKGVKVRVAFEGGNVYNGTMPKFRTDNLFKMKALEASELFKNREVVLVRTIGTQPVTQEPAKRQRKKNIGAPVKPKPAPSPTKVQEPEPPTFDEAQGSPEPPIDDGDNGSGDGEVMTFNNLSDAIIYIAQTYQQEAKTEKEARDILKAHGIKPTIKKG